jgi:hypothetical protein
MSRTSRIVSYASTAIAWLVLCGSATAQDITERIIIGVDVVCRSQPNRSAPVAHRYQLGDLINVTRTSLDAGESWYFDQSRISGQSPSCWVSDGLTASFDRSNPETGLLAIVDHILQRTEPVSFEEYVEVDNLLSNRYKRTLDMSGLLQFRRLVIISRAVRLPSARGRIVEKDPFKYAWMQSHQDLLYYFEPGDDWNIRTSPFWSLHDKYANAPWAEELAWAAAQITVPGDECYSRCILSRVIETDMGYWLRYPTGTHIIKSLQNSQVILKYAAEYGCGGDPKVLSLVETIRASLTAVEAQEKSQLLALLAETAQKCPGSAPR